MDKPLNKMKNIPLKIYTYFISFCEKLFDLEELNLLKPTKTLKFSFKAKISPECEILYQKRA